MSEANRLAFIISRDGMIGAVEFAKRTMKIYRASVLRSSKRGFDKPHHASTKEFRRKFIESYCFFKSFIKETE